MAIETLRGEQEARYNVMREGNRLFLELTRNAKLCKGLTPNICEKITKDNIKKGKGCVMKRIIKIILCGLAAIFSIPTMFLLFLLILFEEKDKK